MNKRSRRLELYAGDCVYAMDSYNTNVVPYPKPYIHTAYRVQVHLPGSQYTESEGHPFRFTASKRGKRRKKFKDVGGPFYTRRSYALVPPVIAYGSKRSKPPPNVGSWNEWHGTSYVPLALPRSFFTQVPQIEPDPAFNGGDIICTLNSSAYPPLPSGSDLAAMGTTAISRCSPTKSPANLAVGLIELAREGLPSVFGASTWKEGLEAFRKGRSLDSAATRSVASEHLNNQFGVKPLISEIQSTGKTFSNMDTLVSQFERDAGKNVRRRYYFPTEYKTETSLVSGAVFANSYGNGVGYAGPNTLVRERHTTIRRWFSGMFTYTIPMSMRQRGVLGDIAARANRLGLDLSLDTLWNAAPWTWLIDWHSNAGDFISNLSSAASYGQVLRYGYMMEHIRVADTYSWPGSHFQGSANFAKGNCPPTTLVSESKRRVAASPFGFGVDLGGLNALQYSILAALGISKR